MAVKPPAKKQEAERQVHSFSVRFREGDGAQTPNESTREIPVTIITEGMGNQVDRHFYSAALLTRTAPKFDGVKAYANHPSKSQETDRPERDIREIVGYYHSPTIVTNKEGKTQLSAIFKVLDGPSYQWAWDLAKEAAAFSKKYSDKDLIGLSINAYGTSHREGEGDQALNIVDDFTEVGSVDMVTQAGARGGFRLRESVKKILEGGNMNDNLQKHGQALAQLHGAIKANPEHEKAYGPALEELMKSHEGLMKASAEPVAPAEPAKGDGEGEPKADDSVDEAFKKEMTRYQGGKMSEGEKKVFELALRARKENEIKENVRMVALIIKESGIPEAYAGDLAELCAGKTQDQVKKIVETRKLIVTPLLNGGKANGAGAGAGGGAGEVKSDLSAKLAESGVKMREVAGAK